MLSRVSTPVPNVKKAYQAVLISFMPPNNHIYLRLEVGKFGYGRTFFAST